MQVSGCTQNGNSRMFLQSAPAVFYLDISYICMFLTFSSTAFYPWSSINLRNISSGNRCSQIISPHYMRNIHLSKKYVPSRNIFVNNLDGFPKYDTQYNFSSGLQFYWQALLMPFLSCNEYGLCPFPYTRWLHDVSDIYHVKIVLYHLISVLIPAVSFCIHIQKLCGTVINTCVCFLISMKLVSLFPWCKYNINRYFWLP